MEEIKIKENSLVILEKEITKSDFPEDYDKLYQLAMYNPGFLIALVKQKLAERQKNLFC